MAAIPLVDPDKAIAVALTLDSLCAGQSPSVIAGVALKLCHFSVPFQLAQSPHSIQITYFQDGRKGNRGGGGGGGGDGWGAHL